MLEDHLLLQPWSSESEGNEIALLGRFENRFRVIHLAADEHYAMHMCTHFLGMFHTCPNVATSSPTT
jgi:hypothetical protein